MRNINLGLIGTGNIAQQHARVIAAMQEVCISGVYSRTFSKAKQFAIDFNIAQCLESMDSLVKTAQPDALMVLVPEEYIYEVSMQALDYGLPIFVEKPAGLTPENNKELADKARLKGVLSMVGFNRRYYSIFQQGLELIRKHGPLMGVMVEGHERIWRQEAVEKKRHQEIILPQWMYANSTHTIDLLRFFGGEVSQLTCINHRYRQKHGDQFACVMELSSGAIGQYQSHWYSPGGWRVALYGKGITVEFKPLESGRWIDSSFNTHDIVPDQYDTQFKPGFYGQMKAFEQLIRTGKKQWPLCDLDDAYQTMLIAQRMMSDPVDRGGL